MTHQLSFKDQVIVITGAGAGLGKDYALYFAARGAKVVVNDLAVVNNIKAADAVVSEIKQKGGVAVANYDSVENGESIIKTAVDHFGKVDVLINNAGIIRDTTFKSMKKDQWNIIIKVHLDAVFSCTKAAWDIFLKQKFGRIINVTSPSGLYGSFGQTNYSTAKAGIVGFTKTLAKEGEKYNIRTNAIAPVAATQMTDHLLSQDLKDMLKVEYITPLVAYLAHKDCEENGSVYEVAGTWISKVRWQRSEGVFFGPEISTEKVKEKISQINDFSKNNTYFDEDQVSLSIVANEYEKYKSNKTNNVALKSDEVFDLISKYLQSGDGSESVKKVAAVYQFDILDKKGGKVIRTWTIDLKNDKGHCKQGKPESNNALFTMTDEDFVSVTSGKLNPQMAFIQGKMKIKGDMKKATLFTPELFPKHTPENVQKYSKAKF